MYNVLQFWELRKRLLWEQATEGVVRHRCSAAGTKHKDLNWRKQRGERKKKKKTPCTFQKHVGQSAGILPVLPAAHMIKTHFTGTIKSVLTAKHNAVDDHRYITHDVMHSPHQLPPHCHLSVTCRGRKKGLDQASHICLLPPVRVCVRAHTRSCACFLSSRLRFTAYVLGRGKQRGEKKPISCGQRTTRRRPGRWIAPAHVVSLTPQWQFVTTWLIPQVPFLLHFLLLLPPLFTFNILSQQSVSNSRQWLFQPAVRSAQPRERGIELAQESEERRIKNTLVI